MGLLHLAIPGDPEVFHDGSRLTFALLLYLAVERGYASPHQAGSVLVARQ